MVVYGLTFAIAVLLAIWADAQSKVRDRDVRFPRAFMFSALLVFVVLATVSALRWEVGTDYVAYERNFNLYVREFREGPDPLGEPGIRLLAWVSDSFGAGSAGMFALASIVTVGLFVRTLWRWSPVFALSVAFLVLTGVWHGSFNGVRQYLACAILFAGHRFIIGRKLAKWFLVVALASMFHISAVVCLLLYFVPTRRTSLRIQIFVLLLGFVGMIGFESILGWIEAATGNMDLSETPYATRNVSPLRIAFAFVPIALFWFFKNRNAVEEYDSWFYVNMLVVHASTYLASANSAYLARFTIYSAPFLAIGLVSVTSVPNKVERILIRGALLLVFCVFLYIDVAGSNSLVNFQWVFNRE